MYDIIIIGQGPAGISTAVYVKRAGLSPLVIAKGYGSLEKSEKIENYYGLPEPVAGLELIKSGIAQAKRLGIEIITDEAVEITRAEAFSVRTVHGSYDAKCVMLATGKPRISAKIEGFEAFKGRGVSFCAVCDGFFYRDKKLAVIGNGDYAVTEASHLLAFTKDIKIFTNGLDFVGQALPEGIEIITDKIVKISGKDFVESLTTEKKEYPADGIFAAMGTASAADFAATMGVMIDNNDIVVDENYMTNIDGLFAAGDCIGGLLQVSKAVADGAMASTGIIKYIKSKK